MTDTTQQPESTQPTLDVPPADELVFLVPEAVCLRREGGRLQMRQGEAWIPVTLARLFPLSEANGWVAVANQDDKEIGVIRDVAALPAVPRSLVEEELGRRYMIPRITRIRVCRDRFDLIEWEVDTDRGPARFLLRHPQENVQHKPPHRVSLMDVEGNRYDIDDITRLDPESRKLLEPVM